MILCRVYLKRYEIKNGSIPLVERKGMDYNTLYVDDLDTDTHK